VCGKDAIGGVTGGVARMEQGVWQGCNRECGKDGTGGVERVGWWQLYSIFMALLYKLFVT